jgi:hypothetical protein
MMSERMQVLFDDNGYRVTRHTIELEVRWHPTSDSNNHISVKGANTPHDGVYSTTYLRDAYGIDEPLKFRMGDVCHHILRDKNVLFVLSSYNHESGAWNLTHLLNGDTADTGSEGVLELYARPPATL